ncbi:quinone oxidoreductase family protein [Allonocardiopsis opalescens]|uniref:NADPH2:quinone reductase n=1 Tax=Allonocardiopsis opalescens TaxID=1144618 RepID=A0A2T0PYI8_9ACTN|nr:zinc-binding dehydrogenase [Allonocardiopsis opalescens]PRX96572.1 NADPH2:quinone reductase [Allonocardiopsis opalescens]
MKALVLHEFGDVGNLALDEVPEPVPQTGHQLIRVRSAGVNYADWHWIEGTYLRRPELPVIPGTEVVGFDAAGRRVLAMTMKAGWAEAAVAANPVVVPLPDFLSDGEALALGLQGFTAWQVLRRCGRLTRGDSVAVFGAAGGTGSLAVQLARAWGARRIIAVASTADKRELALSLGAHAAVDSNDDDLAGALREANGGRPIDLILETTGGKTRDACLSSLAMFGRLVVFGSVTAAPSTPVAPEGLMHGSRSIVGFWASDLFHAQPLLLRDTVTGLIGLIKKGQLRPVVGGEYPLADGAKALEAITSRGTVGKLVLKVGEPGN